MVGSMELADVSSARSAGCLHNPFPPLLPPDLSVTFFNFCNSPMPIFSSSHGGFPQPRVVPLPRGSCTTSPTLPLPLQSGGRCISSLWITLTQCAPTQTLGLGSCATIPSEMSPSRHATRYILLMYCKYQRRGNAQARVPPSTQSLFVRNATV